MNVFLRGVSIGVSVAVTCWLFFKWAISKTLLIRFGLDWDAELSWQLIIATTILAASLTFFVLMILYLTQVL